MSDFYKFSGIENFTSNSSVIFQTTPTVFRDDTDIRPVRIGKYQYMPWGSDNEMPYNVLKLIDGDETLSTCQVFNSEVFYGSGLIYNSENCNEDIADEIENFFEENNIPEYFLGVGHDLKNFAFAVSVIILNREGSKILRILRKEACYCRFAPQDKSGKIPYLLYANWRKAITDETQVECIPILDSHSPLSDLKAQVAGSRHRKFAIISKIPTSDSTYYPIPYYASLFKGNWFNIKRNIGIAKDAKIKNSAPIKYQINISERYWSDLFRREGITDTLKRQQRVQEEKQNILDFLTGAENSGKVWFTTFYISPDGQEQQNVKITKIETSKEGGDWNTDIQEAVNMICFTMRVHSNLVGSVPGKSQSNNSGSDKRELYTIAQALQKPYRDLIFRPHKTIIAFNGWIGAKPECPFIQLTTLDEHTDSKTVKL